MKITIEVPDELEAKRLIEKYKSKKFFPAEGEYFYYIDCDSEYGIVTALHWNNLSRLKGIIATQPTFKTKEEVEEALPAYKAKALALYNIKKYIHDKDYELEPDWSNLDQAKWMIGYDHERSRFHYTNSPDCQYSDQLPLLKSRENLVDTAEACKDDLLTYFGVKL